MPFKILTVVVDTRRNMKSYNESDINEMFGASKNWQDMSGLESVVSDFEPDLTDFISAFLYNKGTKEELMKYFEDAYASVKKRKE